MGISGTGPNVELPVERLDPQALGVRLTDFGDRAVSGISQVTFRLTDGGTFIRWFLIRPCIKTVMVNLTYRQRLLIPGEAKMMILTVYTDSRGEAYVYYQFDSDDTDTEHCT